MTDNTPTDQPAKTPPDSNHKKKETARISLESALALHAKKATSPVPGIPTHPAASGPIPQTIRLKRPPTSQITLQPVTPLSPEKKAGESAPGPSPTPLRPAAAETIKRQTVPISLEDSSALKKLIDLKRTTGPIMGIPTHTGPIPQTIRLKRPPTAPIAAQPLQPVGPSTVVKALRNGEQTATEAPTAVKEPDVSKTVTARIVLEEPIPPATASKRSTTQIPPIATEAPPIPRTIRLKRPSGLSASLPEPGQGDESGRPGDATEEAALAANVDQTAPTVRKAETSRIELPSMESVLAPTVPRKTIKIKRTERTVAPREPAEEAAATAVTPAVDEDDQGLIFPIAAAAATLCIAGLVYIMAAQAFGLHLPLPSSMQLH
ncbi:MAG: hypothetical protein HYV36_01900 [Lentisphaerae bacterium]|nr:hypothetical protein [Lentisphaerota bacterium]